MRIRTAVLIVLVLLIIAIVAYFLFLRPASPVVPGTTSGKLPNLTAGGIGGVLPGAGNGTSSAVLMSLVDDGPAAAYFVGASGTVTIVRPDGTIVSVANREETALSSSSITDLIGASFSHNGVKVAISSGNRQNPQVAIFDIAAKSWTQLPMGTQSPVWSSSDLRLAYLHDNLNGSETLATLDLAKAKPTPVTLGIFSIQDMTLDWSIPGTIILQSRPSAYGQGSILAFDLAGKSLSPVVVGQMGLHAIWGVSGPSILGLAFEANQLQHGGHLRLIDLAGDALQNLSFVTLPSKCVVASGTLPTAVSAATTTASSSQSVATSSRPSRPSPAPAPIYSFYLYCGIPQDQGTLTYYAMPDQYLQRSLFTVDDIYRVDALNGHIDPIISASRQSFDVSAPSITGNLFYFINRYDQKLYSVQLSR